MPASKNLQSQTVKELRQLAADLKIVGRSKLTTKAKLIAAIEKTQARPVATKGPTLREMQAEAKARGLRGFSRHTKAQLEKLLASTAKLAPKPQSLDEMVREAEADFATVESAKALARIIRAGNNGQPAPVADVMHWRFIEARAIAHLRDTTPCERTRRELANRYVACVAGVQA